MKLDRISKLTKSAIVVCTLLVLATATGCGFQTNIAGQNLPTSHYCVGDVEYFPVESDFKLQNQVDQQEQSKADQLSIREGLAE